MSGMTAPTAKVAADIVKAGGTVGIGSHGEFQGLGYHWEMWAMGSGGAPAHDILRAATILGAEAIGMSKDLGSVEAGKLADILVLDGDPLGKAKHMAFEVKPDSLRLRMPLGYKDPAVVSEPLP